MTGALRRQAPTKSSRWWRLRASYIDDQCEQNNRLNRVVHVPSDRLERAQAKRHTHWPATESSKVSLVLHWFVTK